MVAGCWRRSALAVVAVLAVVQATEYVTLAQGSGDLAAREAHRVEQQRVGDVFKAMGVQPGSVVADVGAGHGFFTVRLAEAVGDAGRVYAVDVSASVVRSLRSRVDRKGRKNVEVIEGATDNPRLPEGALDAVLIVNAYHEMTEHQAMLEQIRKALKPTGRLVIVEPISPSRRDATRDAQTRQHEIAPEFVERDARDAGFAVAALEDPFSNHHGHGGEYLIVLTPAGASASEAADGAVEPDGVPGEMTADIRMAASDFATLHRSGKVVVLDATSLEPGVTKTSGPGVAIIAPSGPPVLERGSLSVSTRLRRGCTPP